MMIASDDPRPLSSATMWAYAWSHRGDSLEVFICVSDQIQGWHRF